MITLIAIRPGGFVKPMSDWTFVSLGNLVAQFPQNRDQGDQGQTNDGGLVVGFNFLKQCDPAGLDLVAAGAIEGLIGGDVALDFGSSERSHVQGGHVGVDERSFSRLHGQRRDELVRLAGQRRELVDRTLDRHWLAEDLALERENLVAPMIVAPGLFAETLADLTRASVSAKRKGFDSVDFSTDSSQTGEHARNAIPRRSRSARAIPRRTRENQVGGVGDDWSLGRARTGHRRLILGIAIALSYSATQKRLPRETTM